VDIFVRGRENKPTIKELQHAQIRQEAQDAFSRRCSHRG
jgi:hypothetical protein